LLVSDWRTTFIIGGGPSAGSLDTERLKGGVRLGVNDAAFYKPCDVFFSNDHGYALRTKDRILAFPGERHLAVRPQFMAKFAGWDARLWQRWDWEWPSRRPDALSSGPVGTPGCSGYVALNLAAQMGAMRIILFGYDFHAVYRYFFSAEPYPRVKVPEVVASFRTVAPWYRRQGIEVLNANPDSAIDAFPRITHAEAMA
jgi:hypothetical protein